MRSADRKWKNKWVWPSLRQFEGKFFEVTTGTKIRQDEKLARELKSIGLCPKQYEFPDTR